MRHLVLSSVIAFILLLAALGVAGIKLLGGDSSATPDRPDRYHGGTARQWYNQTQDWQHLTRKEHHIADRYRRLNNKLLKQLEAN